MAEGNALKVLDVYTHFKSRPGEALVSDHFLGVGKLRRWPTSELQAGIEQARQSGWIEEADRGWRLTESGFREAARKS